MNWIENRSSLTRWILVPLVFIGLSSLVHALVIWTSWLLSIFWGHEAEENLWFWRYFIADGFSTFIACRFAGATAPKFKFTTTCVASAVYLFLNLFIFYFFLTMKEFRDATTIAEAFSSTLGAIGAIWDAKKNPSRVNTPKTYKTVKPPS